MPSVIVPKELKPVIAEFQAKLKSFQVSDQGQKALKNVADFVRLGLDRSVSPVSDQVMSGAADTLNWIGMLPEKLVYAENAPKFQFQELSEKALQKAIGEGLQVLFAGVRAVLTGAMEPTKFTGRAIVHAAFGIDAGTKILRGYLFEPEFKWPVGMAGLDLATLEKLVRAGAISQYLQELGICGSVAQADREWASSMTAFGRVDSLLPSKGVPGDIITIAYSGFLANPIPATSVGEIFLSLPRLGGGCSKVNVRTIDRVQFDPSQFKDSGTISVTLPEDIGPGNVGFLFQPWRTDGSGGGTCSPGSLITAAGMVQSMLGDACGAMGTMIGQNLVNLATRVEAGRNLTGQNICAGPVGSQHLDAGRPRIDWFRVLEPGDIHPRNFITLEWSVTNADSIEILAEDVPGTENLNELPPILGSIAMKGTIRLVVNCSCRWEGVYILRARNGNGGSPNPVEARLHFRSGFSHYRVGVGKADITDRRRGLGMAGFAWKSQTTDGTVSLPLYARAFVIEENVRATAPNRVAMVVADIWTCTQAVKTEVVKRLNAASSRLAGRYTVDNVLIGGTHTHAGPGGYSEYFLYNFTIGGFDAGVFERIVSGIVNAIFQADQSRAPGRVYVAKGDVDECGFNRSNLAYQRNVEYATGQLPDHWTDKEMLLLRFDKDVGNLHTTPPLKLGALNWYAIHATSLGMFNTSISGDNKGWAEQQFEAEMAADNPQFVAAFGNASAGDVSGNVLGYDALGPIVRKPLGGYAATSHLYIPPSTRTASSIQGDIARMEALGNLQADRAKNIFLAANTELTGPIQSRHVHVDMSRVSIDGIPGARTYPAALGVSFGAGSSEDSVAYITLGNFEIDAAMLEGMTHAEMILGAIEVFPALSFVVLNIPTFGFKAPMLVVSLLGALAGGPLDLSLVPELLSMVAGLVIFPHGRTFLAAFIGSIAFPGNLKDAPPVATTQGRTIGIGTWEWKLPLIGDWPADFSPGHGAKPILFPVGLSRLRLTDSAGNVREMGCPLVPHVLPIQLLRIGTVGVAGVPAEFTAVAGKRLKDRLLAAFGGTLTDVAVSGYSNAYSGYVTTPEEYGAQHYEGASTLYGPHTLAAYLQVFDKLAEAMVNNRPNPLLPTSTPGPFEVQAITTKP